MLPEKSVLKTPAVGISSLAFFSNSIDQEDKTAISSSAITDRLIASELLISTTLPNAGNKSSNRF
jgi:hypothetical protein